MSVCILKDNTNDQPVRDAKRLIMTMYSKNINVYYCKLMHHKYNRTIKMARKSSGYIYVHRMNVEVYVQTV